MCMMPLDMQVNKKPDGDDEDDDDGMKHYTQFQKKKIKVNLLNYSFIFFFSTQLKVFKRIDYSLKIYRFPLGPCNIHISS